MKRNVLLLGLVLVMGGASWASLVQDQLVAGDSQAGWWLLRFFEGTEYQRELEVQRPALDWIPGFSSGDLQSVFPDTRTKVAVTPNVPIPSDEIFVEVSCWVPASNYEVEQADLDIQGSQITLDLYWASSGIGLQAFMWSTYKTSLGTLEAGTYMVRVNNSGAVSSTVTRSFQVREPLRAQLVPGWSK